MFQIIIAALYVASTRFDLRVEVAHVAVLSSVYPLCSMGGLGPTAAVRAIAAWRLYSRGSAFWSVASAQRSA